MIDERVNRKVEVSRFVLKKKFKGFDEKTFAANVEAALLKKTGEDEIKKMADEELAEILQGIVAEETRKTAATLPLKKGKLV